MYLFFLIFGVIFILAAGIFINYIYEFFPINKVTNFIYSTNNNHLFNDISTLNIPIIIWGLFELPIFGKNPNFIFSLLTNLFISCAIIYIIKYGSEILFNRKDNLVNIISLVVASIIGTSVSILILRITPIFNFNIYISLIGYILIVIALIINRLSNN